MKASLSSWIHQKTAAAASSRLNRTKARRWEVLEFTGELVALSLLLGGNLSLAQTSLPVYPVQQSGAYDSQALQLATSLGVPSGMYSLINGEVSFIDPTNYMVVPTVAVTDPEVISNLTAGTVNQFPGIPLNVRELDLSGLSNQVVLSTTTALSRMATALNVAGLTPQTPQTFSTVVGHTTCTLNYTNPSGGVVSNSQSLDTRVSYQFTLGGYPLIGPGAQVQVTFPGGQGTTAPTNAAHLVYAARQLGQTGPSVLVFGSTQASNRVANLYYPGLNAQITPQLIYWCPPLSIPTVGTIIPHYQCTASITVTGNMINLMPVLIPATDDPNYVPVPQLTAFTDPQSGQVVASVFASGGLPPYTYVWGGSDAKVSTNTLPSVAYTPRIRVTPPTLLVDYTDGTHRPTNCVVMSWPDPSTGFILESATDLRLQDWSEDTHPMVISNGLRTVTVDVRESPTKFFRLRLASATLPQEEEVSVTVIDANGVSVPAHQTLSVQAVPIPAGAPDPPITYGCESPYDAGLGTADRVSWQAGMATPGAGGGVQRFCWTGNLAWPGDFIEPPVPGVLPGNPPVFGDADFANWGVNTADIVFYVGHGAPWGISTTYPCFPTANPGSVLWDPLITVGVGGPAVTTHWGGNCGAQANFNVPWYPGSWRTGAQWPNDTLEWLCLLSCDVLQANWNGQTAWQRWGPNFNGLHIVTGFRTVAWAGTGFPQVFVNNMLGVGRQPMSIVSAWFAAAAARENRPDGTGRAAAMGPTKWLWVSVPTPHWALFSDQGDFYWGKGPVGFNLYPPFAGSWYVSQP